MSATPIQNKIDDLGSLIRVLRVVPFDSNANFRQYISEPLLTDREAGGQNLRLLLRSMCLRRTRNLLDIPKPEDQTITLFLSTEERGMYSQIIEDTKRKIDDFISSRSITKAYNGVFHAILRLRLLCNHGTQQISPSRTESESSFVADGVAEEGKLSCPFCSCEINIPDRQDDSSLGASPPDSIPILCPACLSPYEIDPPLKQKMKEQQSIGSNRVQPVDATENSSPQPDSDDRTSPKYLRPRPSLNGHSSKLSVLLSNIQAHMLSSKRFVDLLRYKEGSTLI